MTCTTAKKTRTEIPHTSENQSHNILDIIHSDVYGPVEVPSKKDAKYFVNLIDGATRWTTVSKMNQKSEIFLRVVKFLIYIPRGRQGEKSEAYEATVKGNTSGINPVLFFKKWYSLSKNLCRYSETIWDYRANKQDTLRYDAINANIS